MSKIILIISAFLVAVAPARAAQLVSGEQAAFRQFAMDFANSTYANPRRHIAMYAPIFKFCGTNTTPEHMLERYLTKVADVQNQGITNMDSYIKYPSELFSFTERNGIYYCIYPFFASDRSCMLKGSIGIAARRKGNTFEVFIETRPAAMMIKHPISMERPVIKAVRAAILAKLNSADQPNEEAASQAITAATQAILTEWRLSRNPETLAELGVALWQLSMLGSNNAAFVANLLAENLGDATREFVPAIMSAVDRERCNVLFAAIDQRTVAARNGVPSQSPPSAQSFVPRQAARPSMPVDDPMMPSGLPAEPAAAASPSAMPATPPIEDDIMKPTGKPSVPAVVPTQADRPAAAPVETDVAKPVGKPGAPVMRPAHLVSPPPVAAPTVEPIDP